MDLTKEGEGEFWLLIAGSRSFTDYPTMEAVADTALAKQTAMGRAIVIVSGGARGADALAEAYAKKRGYGSVVVPADWEGHGRSAGYIRNDEMHRLIAGHPNRGCLAFWDGESRGTAHNFGLAERYGTPLRVYHYPSASLVHPNSTSRASTSRKGTEEKEGGAEEGDERSL